MKLKLFSLIVLLLLITSCSSSEVNQTEQAAKDSFNDYDKNIKNEPVKNKDLPIKKAGNLKDGNNVKKNHDDLINEKDNVVIDSGEFEVSGFPVGDYFSSTKLLVTLNGLGDFKIKYQETSPGTGEVYEVEIFNQNSITLSDLKSSTTYSVEVESCELGGCYSLGSNVGITSEEYWQVHGDSSCTNDEDCVDLATIVLEDSATAAYPIKYPDEDLTTLYTNKKPLSEDGTMKAFAQNEGGINLDDFLEFDWIGNVETGPYIHVCDYHQEDCSDVEINMATYQLIPLASEEAMLLVFEGSKSEETGEILDDGYVVTEDSVQLYQMKSFDGYVGIDYNSEIDSNICDFDDLVKGGNCDYDLILAAGEESGLSKIRQTKIAYPILDSIFWNEAEYTFMGITGQDQCGLTGDGIFMGQLIDGIWEVTQDSVGCPIPLFTHGHGPVLGHLGEERYKLYAETYELEEGESYQITEVTKPFKLIYADSSLSGSTDSVDFEDFENEEVAREVNFIWANGDLVSPGYESGFGDHFIFYPDYHLENQIMFLNLNGFDNTDEGYRGSPGIGVAYLVNP